MEGEFCRAVRLNINCMGQYEYVKNNNSYKAMFSDQSQNHCAVQASYDKKHINVHFKQT